jgi:hypothetical protein
MTMTILRQNRRPGATSQSAPTQPAPSGLTIPVAVKTAMSPRPLMGALDSRMTLSQAVRELRQMPPADAADGRLLQQLTRELSGAHEYLAIGPSGELTRVDPETTTVGDIAAPRAVRTPQGVETTRIAACEIQAYAPVG